MKFFWICCLLFVSCAPVTTEQTDTTDYKAAADCTLMWVDVFYPNIEALVNVCLEMNTTP